MQDFFAPMTPVNQMSFFKSTEDMRQTVDPRFLSLSPSATMSARSSSFPCSSPYLSQPAPPAYTSYPGFPMYQNYTVPGVEVATVTHENSSLMGVECGLGVTLGQDIEVQDIPEAVQVEAEEDGFSDLDTDDDLDLGHRVTSHPGVKSATVKQRYDSAIPVIDGPTLTTTPTSVAADLLPAMVSHTGNLTDASHNPTPKAQNAGKIGKAFMQKSRKIGTAPNSQSTKAKVRLVSPSPSDKALSARLVMLKTKNKKNKISERNVSRSAAIHKRSEARTITTLHIAAGKVSIEAEAKKSSVQLPSEHLTANEFTANTQISQRAPMNEVKVAKQLPTIKKQSRASLTESVMQPVETPALPERPTYSGKTPRKRLPFPLPPVPHRQSLTPIRAEQTPAAESPSMASDVDSEYAPSSGVESPLPSDIESDSDFEDNKPNKKPRGATSKRGSRPSRAEEDDDDWLDKKASKRGSKRGPKVFGLGRKEQNQRAQTRYREKIKARAVLTTEYFGSIIKTLNRVKNPQAFKDAVCAKKDAYLKELYDLDPTFANKFEKDIKT
ncbi:hypothetical protein IAU60_004610 [Kwoniella sp. DSM 27419]